MVEHEYNEKNSIPFFPNHLLTEFAVIMLVLGSLMLLAVMIPRELGDPANPLETPLDIKPEWYFWWMFELFRELGKIKGLPEVVGLSIPAIMFLVTILIPWIDRSEHRHPMKRPFFTFLGVVTLIAILILTVLIA
ncbi:MAG: hypothetical protein ACE5KT_02445 [Methanosarcinales archaeon]